jgi:MarR family transcriptional regulator, temperature-dependent positive regulator of motility
VRRSDEADGDPATTPVPATPPELLDAPGYLVRRLYQAYTALWNQRVDSRLTGPQFAILQAVQHNPGVDQGSLASVVALDRSTMADVARRLERRELIVRRTDTVDTRRKLLSLTETGTRVLAETSRRARELDAVLLAGDPSGGRQGLLGDLTRLSLAWEQLTER